MYLRTLKVLKTNLDLLFITKHEPKIYKDATMSIIPQ
jgi:hypothetical protein